MGYKYIVYKARTSNKLFESEDYIAAVNYVQKLESEQRRVGNFEYERYERVKVVR